MNRFLSPTPYRELRVKKEKEAVMLCTVLLLHKGFISSTHLPSYVPPGSSGPNGKPNRLDFWLNGFFIDFTSSQSAVKWRGMNPKRALILNNRDESSSWSCLSSSRRPPTPLCEGVPIITWRWEVSAVRIWQERAIAFSSSLAGGESVKWLSERERGALLWECVTGQCLSAALCSCSSAAAALG